VDTSASLQMYFRLRAGSFSVSTGPAPGGLTSVTVSGPPGVNCIIQGSVDLKTWIDLSTNTAPCTYVDTTGLPLRFYRAIPVPMPSATAGFPVITTQPAGQTVSIGDPIRLQVAATGPEPLSFQWRFKGSVIPSATENSFAIQDAQSANAGLYTVTVGNSAGTVPSAAAIVNVLPKLGAQLTASGLRITWPSPYLLQVAANPAGPFVDVPGAVSPYIQNTSLAPQNYFRLSAPQGTVTTTSLSGGQVSISLTGASGINYVIQASSNLSTWENLSTNTAPSVFIDTMAGESSMRYYRAIPAGW